jgi:hypothetical protein
VNVLADVFRFVNLLAAAVILGSMVTQVVMLQPVLQGLPRETTIAVHRVASRAEWRLLPPVGTVAVLGAIGVIAVLLAQGKLTWSVGALTVAGLVFAIVEAVVGNRFYRPADELLLEADAESYPAALARFTRLQALRLPLATLEFGCFLAAVLAA